MAGARHSLSGLPSSGTDADGGSRCDLLDLDARRSRLEGEKDESRKKERDGDEVGKRRVPAEPTDGVGGDQRSECEPDEDCNENGIRDICDIGAGTSADCNVNNTPDECDLSTGTSLDDNSNGIPDECDRTPAVAGAGPSCSVAGDCAGAWEGADCVGGRCYIAKNRYLSIDPTANTGLVAYQVELTEAADYPAAEGRSWWVDQPDCYDFPNGDVVEPRPSSCEGAERFGWVSKLASTPVTRVWTEPTLHVTGCPVVPAATYGIRASPDGGGSFSESLEINTVHDPSGDAQSWGDVTGGPVEQMPGLWLPPERAMNFTDVGSAISTFENRLEGTGFPPRAISVT